MKENSSKLTFLIHGFFIRKTEEHRKIFSKPGIRMTTKKKFKCIFPKFVQEYIDNAAFF